MIKLKLKILYLQFLQLFKKKRHPFYEMCDYLPLKKLKEFKNNNKQPSVTFESNNYLLNISYGVNYLDLKLCNTSVPFVTLEKQLETKHYDSPDRLIGLINSLLVQIRDKEKRLK